MLKFLKKEANMTHTENGAVTYRSTQSECLDLFATIGALRRERDEEITNRFLRAYAEDADLAMKTLFFARDIRGGIGERRVFRTILKWLANNEPRSLEKNIQYIAEYGRYDDLLVLMGTTCEGKVLHLIKKRNASMKVLKNLVCCAAFICLMFVLAMPAHAASKADELLQLVNAERAQAGVAPLSMGSSALNAAAQARAKELTVNYSYNRPNGSREFTILPEYGVDDVSVGENYWAAAENASDVVAAWNRYDFFKERMLDKDATSVGIGYYACFFKSGFAGVEVNTCDINR